MMDGCDFILIRNKTCHKLLPQKMNKCKNGGHFPNKAVELHRLRTENSGVLWCCRCGNKPSYVSSILEEEESFYSWPSRSVSGWSWYRAPSWTPDQMFAFSDCYVMKSIGRRPCRGINFIFYFHLYTFWYTHWIQGMQLRAKKIKRSSCVQVTILGNFSYEIFLQHNFHYHCSALCRTHASHHRVPLPTFRYLMPL
jgi:hypothetical protein